MLLISSYDQFKNEFRNLQKRRNFYKSWIANGVTGSYDSLISKIKLKKTGRGRIVWKYVSVIDDIFEEDRAVNFPKTVSSIDSWKTENTSIFLTL